MARRKKEEVVAPNVTVKEGYDEVHVVEDNPMSKKVTELYSDKFNDNMNVLKDSEGLSTQMMF